MNPAPPIQCGILGAGWRNRLAYDSTRAEPERKTWTLNSPGAVSLIPAGLLGPVNLRVGQIVTIP